MRVMKFKSTKRYGHELGFSCCFRQWRATHSHCRFLHGYSIAVNLEFEREGGLDDKNWVMDFGGLKDLKKWLSDKFDHKTIIAHDDPMLSYFKAMEANGIVELTVFKDVGCEKFAEEIYNYARSILPNEIILTNVEVREHGANGASYGI